MKDNIGKDQNYALSPQVIALYMQPDAPNRLPSEADMKKNTKAVREVKHAVLRLFAAGKIKMVKALGGKVGIKDWNKKKSRSIFKRGTPVYYAP
jgi:hypothetical protein